MPIIVQGLIRLMEKEFIMFELTDKGRELMWSLVLALSAVASMVVMICGLVYYPEYLLWFFGMCFAILIGIEIYQQVRLGLMERGSFKEFIKQYIRRKGQEDDSSSSKK